MLEQALQRTITKIQFSIVTKDGNTKHDFYHHFLKNKGIQPSMSRKGNSPDNAV